MASAGILIATTLLSAGAGYMQQKSAKDAAEAQSESEQNFLDRKLENQRVALTENSKRQQRNKQRYLAQVRAQQAASGFNTSSGTPLAIFGDIESSLDDQINEATSQALDAIGTTQNQKKNLQFGDKLRDSAHTTNMWALGIKTATSFAGGYTQNYDRTRSDVFGVFKKPTTQTG